MTPDSTQDLAVLFEAALDLDPPERAEFLNKACKGNAVLRDPLRIDPTSIRYFKVYDQYRKAVEASLLLVALTRSQEELRERAAEYGTWFPDVPFVMQNLEEKLRKAPEVTRPRS